MYILSAKENSEATDDGTYSLGMPDPVNDSELYINYPVDTPASGEIMTRRPLFHHIMMQKEYFSQYHEYYRMFIDGYFESGLFEQRVSMAVNMISPYVKKDPTAYISYEDYVTGVETITEFCRLRAKSVDLQLAGIIPSTIKGQSAQGGKENFIPGDTVWLPDMGEIADLKNGVH